MKKLIYVILIVCLALFGAFAMTACDKDVSITDKKYYLYDEATNSYDENNYIDISGDKCTVGIKDDDDDSKAVKLDGTVEKKDNNDFSLKCIYKIKSLSDIMTDKDIKELKEELGLKNFEAEFDAQLTFTASGRIYPNTLKVTRLKAEISGFKGMFAGINGTMSDSSNDIFCRKGNGPDFSVAITFDMCGGTLGGKSEVVVRTDSVGGIVFPTGTPTRDGYEFIGYSWWKDFMHEVNEGSKNDEDGTVYTIWRKICTVTFDVNSAEYEIVGDTQLVLKEHELIPKPLFAKKVTNPKTQFKGWYIGDTEVSPGDIGATESCTITAQWYTEQEVNAYNAKLGSDTSESVYIHVVELNAGSNNLYGSSITHKIFYSNGSIATGRGNEYNKKQEITGSVYYISLFDLPDGEIYYDCVIEVTVNTQSGDVVYTIPKNTLKRNSAIHLFFDADTRQFRTSW